MIPQLQAVGKLRSIWPATIRRVSVVGFLCILATSALATLGFAEDIAEKQDAVVEAREALDLGLQWLAKNQGDEGNWESKDLALVSLGALAFMADGHAIGEGEYGQAAERALRHVLENTKDSGLIDIAGRYRENYNHGFATLVLGQAVALGWKDGEAALEKAVEVALDCQCDDGGWNYEARPAKRGHDVSLFSTQLAGLNSAQQAGVELPEALDDSLLKCLKGFYHVKGGRRSDNEEELKELPGQFRYSRTGGPESPTIAALGVVCMHRLGAGNDWRVAQSMEVVHKHLERTNRIRKGSGQFGMNAYTMFYVAQSLHYEQDNWEKHHADLCDRLVKSQYRDPKSERHGQWSPGAHVGGKPGHLFATSVACLVLAMQEEHLPMWKRDEAKTQDGKR